jgi:hypothetical protein
LKKLYALAEKKSQKLSQILDISLKAMYVPPAALTQAKVLITRQIPTELPVE